MFCQRSKPKPVLVDAEQQRYTSVFEDDPTLKRLITQSTILAVYYTLWAIIEWLELALGHKAIESGNLSCLYGRFIVITTTQGAWQMFGMTILMVLQSIIIVAVFYEVPKRCYGQFAAGDASFLNIEKKNTITLDISQKFQENQFKDMMLAV